MRGFLGIAMFGAGLAYFGGMINVGSRIGTWRDDSKDSKSVREYREGMARMGPYFWRVGVIAMIVGLIGAFVSWLFGWKF